MRVVMELGKEFGDVTGEGAKEETGEADGEGAKEPLMLALRRASKLLTVRGGTVGSLG